MKYTEIKETQANGEGYFFAFSDTQLKEGLQEVKREPGEKVFSANAGLFGTKKGLDNLFAFYENRRKRIEKECTPQEVYDFEFLNFECEYICDDAGAIEQTAYYFGQERTANEVQRKRAYKSVEQILREEAENAIF